MQIVNWWATYEGIPGFLFCSPSLPRWCMWCARGTLCPHTHQHFRFFSTFFVAFWHVFFNLTKFSHFFDHSILFYNILRVLKIFKLASSYAISSKLVPFWAISAFFVNFAHLSQILLIFLCIFLSVHFCAVFVFFFEAGPAHPPPPW